MPGASANFTPVTFDFNNGYYGGEPDAVFPTYEYDGKYKTELCKNWIETAKCRYGDLCRFAHGQEELTRAAINSYSSKFKTKNCRTFYHTKECVYGYRCMFRHEHRNFTQLHRHYYTPQLFKLETQFHSAVDKARYLETFESRTVRLPIFADIHAEWDAQQAPAPQAEQSDSELSDIELSPEMAAESDFNGIKERFHSPISKSESSLNTTVDSLTEELSSKIAPSLCSIRACFPLESSDAETGDDSESEEIDVAPHELGLDFV